MNALWVSVRISDGNATSINLVGGVGAILNLRPMYSLPTMPGAQHQRISPSQCRPSALM